MCKNLKYHNEMILHEQKYPEIFTTYYQKPGQTVDNTKITGRSLALFASKDIFNRYLNYSIEEKKAAILAEEQSKNLTRKNAKYEMPKQWDDKLKLINQKREERRLLKEKKEEDDRNQFMKELTEKKKIEREKVIGQAKRLLLYRQPQCRLINRALLASECIKELNAQKEFEQFLKDSQKRKALDFDKHILDDTEKYKNEEKKKLDEQLKMKNQYKEQLTNQIAVIRKNAESLEMKEKLEEQKDIENMSREMEEIQRLEKKQADEKKSKLKRIFTEALEEKAKFQKEQQECEDELNKSRQIYAETQHKIRKMLKTKLDEERKAHFKRAENLAKIVVAVKKEIDPEEEERRIDEIMKEKEAEEQEQLKKKEEKKRKMKLEIEKFQQQVLKEKKKRAQDAENMLLYEVLERIKKDKFDKEVELQKQTRAKQKKKEYAEELQKQMLENAEKSVESKQTEDDSSETLEMLNFTNERILSYGEEVLKESTGVRPLFPIIKAIETVKKEIGIYQPKRSEELTACERKNKMKLELEKFQQQKAIEKEKLAKETENMYLERMKQNEVDSENQIENRTKDVQRKKKYAEDLQRQILAKQARKETRELLPEINTNSKTCSAKKNMKVETEQILEKEILI